MPETEAQRKEEQRRFPKGSYPLDDVAKANGVDARTMKRLAQRGLIRTIMIGGQVRVPETEANRIAVEGVPLPDRDPLVRERDQGGRYSKAEAGA